MIAMESVEKSQRRSTPNIGNTAMHAEGASFTDASNVLRYGPALMSHELREARAAPHNFLALLPPEVVSAVRAPLVPPPRSFSFSIS